MYVSDRFAAVLRPPDLVHEDQSRALARGVGQFAGLGSEGWLPPMRVVLPTPARAVLLPLVAIVVGVGRSQVLREQVEETIVTVTALRRPPLRPRSLP